MKQKPRFEQERDHKNKEAILRALYEKGFIDRGGILHPMGSEKMFNAEVTKDGQSLFLNLRARDTYHDKFINGGLRVGTNKFNYARAHGAASFRVVVQFIDRAISIKIPDVDLEVFPGFQRDRSIEECYDYVEISYRKATPLWTGTVCEHAFEHQGAR